MLDRSRRLPRWDVSRFLPPPTPSPGTAYREGGGRGRRRRHPPPPRGGGRRRCPPLSPAVHSRPPPPLLMSASIRRSSSLHPPATYLPPSSAACPPPFPPPCKVSLWPPMTACLLLISLRPGDKDEEETRSPSYPDARRIIGRGTADDSMPFLFYCNPMRRRLGSPSYPTAPDAHRIIGRGIVDDTASYYWPWHRQRQHAFFIFIATQRRR